MCNNNNNNVFFLFASVVQVVVQAAVQGNEFHKALCETNAYQGTTFTRLFVNLMRTLSRALLETSIPW